MKNLIILVSILAVALPLAGCSGGEDKLDTQAPPVENPQKESKPTGFKQPPTPPSAGGPPPATQESK